MPTRPPIHQPPAVKNRRKTYDKAKGTTAERGYGARHRRWRQRVLDRDNHLCQACLRNDKLTPAKVADHIVPHQRGGAQYDLNNGQALCLPCHARKTNRERRHG